MPSQISALVILKPASGKPISGTESVTSATIAHHMPDPDAAGKLILEWKKLGFTPGPLIGNSFSIEGSTAQFEKVFGGRVKSSEKGLFFLPKAAEEPSAQTRQLPTSRLPEAMRKLIDTVTFLEPPDFGPTDFGATP